MFLRTEIKTMYLQNVCGNLRNHEQSMAQRCENIDDVKKAPKLLTSRYKKYLVEEQESEEEAQVNDQEWLMMKNTPSFSELVVQAVVIVKQYTNCKTKERQFRPSKKRLKLFDHLELTDQSQGQPSTRICSTQCKSRVQLLIITTIGDTLNQHYHHHMPLCYTRVL